MKPRTEPPHSNNGGTPADTTVYGRAAVPIPKGPAVPARSVAANDHAVESLAAPAYGTAPPYAGPRYEDEGRVDEGRTAAAPQRHALRKVITLAVLIVVVFAGAAVGYGFLQPTVYGGQAEYVLTPRPDLSDTAVDRAMLTQTMVITSDQVLAPVATRARIPISRLREAVSAEIVGRSTIMRVTVADRSRRGAVELVRLVAAQYQAEVRSVSPGTTQDGQAQAPPIQIALLTPPSALDTPLQPHPLRDLAAGTLLGLLVSATVVVLVLRPRFLARPTPHWE